MRLLRIVAPALFASTAFACAGSTGSGLVSFPAYAAGPPDATSPLAFDTSGGYHVSLTTATMHIGAVYLTTSAFGASSASTSCIEPGRYVAEVAGGVDVNLLSPDGQPFSVTGTGTVDQALTGELWLTGGDVTSETDTTPIVTLAGTATRGTESYPFEATVTISSNRTKPVTDPSQPGLNPLCKRRIVQVAPISVDVVAHESLYVRVDPRGWFNSIDFSKLDVESTDPPLYQIPDSDSSPTAGAVAGRNLLTGILTGVLPSGASTYSFDFE
jgi:hypothetical protein